MSNFLLRELIISMEAWRDGSELKAFAALTENPVVIPSTHKVIHNQLPRGLEIYLRSIVFA